MLTAPFSARPFVYRNKVGPKAFCPRGLSDFVAYNVFEINAGRAFLITAKGKILKANLQHFLE